MDGKQKKYITTSLWIIVFQFILVIVVLCLFESAYNDFAVFLIIGGNTLIGFFAYCAIQEDK